MALVAQREPFALSLSKGRRIAAGRTLVRLAQSRSWFDRLATNGVWAR